MIIGTVREIKDDEYRVGITPAGVEVLTQAGHTVLVERGAGLGSGYDDAQYARHGARIVASAGEVWAEAEMVVKVKEPLESEWPLMRRGQVVFTYFHFAASRELTEGVASTGIVAIAYETITDAAGNLPLLTPMSEVAGRMAVQVGAWSLECHTGGRGVLLGGVPGVMPARVVVLGAGVVGANAARIASGMGADVQLFDIRLERLRYLSDVMPPNVRTAKSDPAAIRAAIVNADLVIGAVLIPGGRTPVLVSREDVRSMKRGAVIVDVGVDQGGCVETTRPTTHHAPTYEEEGVIHYCVANMPGAVPRTSTQALTNATLPYVVQLAAAGWRAAAKADEHLARGVNMIEGCITCPGVAEAHGMELAELKL
ncbi:MAG: alanine dehydrogenase [Planctomycetales bacterium 4484_123]|nr:MAG: alanine dehydrogenase [Planctomycetales bacterium 4484_123]